MNKSRSNLLSSRGPVRRSELFPLNLVADLNVRPPDWTPRREEVGPRPGTPRDLPWYPGREGIAPTSGRGQGTPGRDTGPGKTIGLFKVGYLFIIPYSNIYFS